MVVSCFLVIHRVLGPSVAASLCSLSDQGNFQRSKLDSPDDSKAAISVKATGPIYLTPKAENLRAFLICEQFFGEEHGS